MPNWTRDDGTSAFEAGVEHDSRVSLNEMLDAVKRDASQFFAMGAMRARKKLPNGAVVTLTIKMPPGKP